MASDYNRKYNMFRPKKLRADYKGVNRDHADRRSIDFTKIIISKTSRLSYLLCEKPILTLDYATEFRLIKDPHGFLYVIDHRVIENLFDMSKADEEVRDRVKQDLKIEKEKLLSENENECEQ